MLTANKRGPTLVPVADSDRAAEDFDAQEAAFAASAAAGPVSADGADRPLTGAKPPPAASDAAVAQERPLSGVGGGGIGGNRSMGSTGSAFDLREEGTGEGDAVPGRGGSGGGGGSSLWYE